MNKKIYLEVVEYNEDLQKLSSSFYCGNQFIDNFLKGNESLESDICKTFVMIRKTETDESIEQEIVGFYSLSSDSVLCYSDANKIMLDGGAIRIFMFAIDEKYKHKQIKINHQERTYASVLLLDCLDLIDKIVNEYLGVKYIILNSTREGHGLYVHTGDFVDLTDDEDFMLSDVEGNDTFIPMYKYIKDEFY